MAQMFPSTNNGINVDPIYYSDLEVHHIPFFNDITSSFKHDHQDQLLLSFFQSSTPFSPCYDQLGLQDHGIFLHDQSHENFFLPSDTTAAAIAHMMNSNRNNDDKNEELTKICKRKSHSNVGEQISNPRKKSSKRDRHSKINTAQGPRDRRMRLSLKVAREFFDLQDKLRFDKASKTVEWLLVQARPAIKNLFSTLPHMSNHSSSAGTKSASSTSEGEVVSEIDEAAAAAANEPSISKGKPSSSCVNKGPKKLKPPRKSTFLSLGKESREKARARARERTRKKQWSRRMMDESKQAKNHELNQLSCLTSFDTTAEESGTQCQTMNKSPSMKMLAETEETPISCHDQQQQQLLVTTDGMIDDSLAIMGKWSPSFVINHLYNTALA